MRAERQPPGDLPDRSRGAAITAPLSDARLTAIRELTFLDAAITELDRTSAAVVAVRELVREVDRLRAQVAEVERERGEAARLSHQYRNEVERLRAQLADFTHPVATCFGCHHIAPWHVGDLGKTERPCTQRDCNCADLTTEDRTVDSDEWVRCARPHCPNGEWFALAPERGWTHGLGQWVCPTHAAPAGSGADQ